MSQSAPTTPTVIEDCPLIINVPDLGPVLVLTTTRSIKFSEGKTLKTGLDTMMAEITRLASNVIVLEAKLADASTWLTEQLGYAPKDHQTEDYFLTPLFTEKPKTPTGEGELPE